MAEALLQQAATCLDGVTVTHTGRAPPRLPTVLTLPHAAPTYSGRTAALAIVSELQPTRAVQLLGFRHDGTQADCREDHSVTNVQALLAAHGCTPIEVHCAEHPTWQAPADKTQVVVSTDFSHFNSVGAPTMDVAAICRQDTRKSVQLLNQSQGWDAQSSYHQPCGRRALALVQPWTSQWHVLYYENSNPQVSKGVGYAVLRGFRLSHTDPLRQWKAQLDSRVLAWAHLKHVWTALGRGDKTLPPLCWSPLQTLQGSCFLTVYDADHRVLSCFGGWEEKGATLWEALAAAYATVRTHAWHTTQPETARAGLAQLSISLIAPQTTWVETEQCAPDRGCRVEGRHTYLASVWEQYSDPAAFTAGLREKAGGSTAPLKVYDEVVWQALRDPTCSQI